MMYTEDDLRKMGWHELQRTAKMMGITSRLKENIIEDILRVQRMENRMPMHQEVIGSVVQKDVDDEPFVNDPDVAAEPTPEPIEAAPEIMVVNIDAPSVIENQTVSVKVPTVAPIADVPAAPVSKPEPAPVVSTYVREPDKTIDQCYLEVLGRSVDRPGLSTYRKHFREGMTAEKLKTILKNSDEYKKKSEK